MNDPDADRGEHTARSSINARSGTFARIMLATTVLVVVVTWNMSGPWVLPVAAAFLVLVAIVLAFVSRSSRGGR